SAAAAGIEPARTRPGLSALIARLFEDIIRASAAGAAQTLAHGARTIQGESNLSSLRSLASTVSDVNNVAFDLAHLSRNTRNLSSGAQTIASAAAELVASVEDIARNSEGAASDAAETNRNVLAGRTAVEQVNGAISNIATAVEETARSVDELSVASEQIGQILTVIESIAGQTNLLALNATIEAARAGAAGRGFAVVASEVKNLATQTSKSTEDITRRITSLREGMGVILSTMERSKTAVVEGQTAISEAAATMTVVADQVGNVSARMQGISDILHQQKGASAEIAASIDKVAIIAGDNHDLLVSMATHLHTSNARFSENAKAWFAAGSHRSLVEMAKIDHVMFKKRVMDVLMGRDTWRVAEVPDHHNCRLGKWYDAITAAEITSLPAYGKLVAPHQRVHAAGSRAIAAHEAGDMDGALAALEDLNEASIEVLAILDEMSQVLNGRLAHLDAATPRTPATGGPAPHTHSGACCSGTH
ncbi:MAG: hypothetical protein HC900_05190, partial [Methylacidiphilales bacterium]|nr:hypothetical protein [Candidatus Methylacidiphilales bacterium]